VRLFTRDPEVLAYGTSYLRIVSLGFPFYAFGMVAGEAFNGAGDTRTPTLINFFVFWVVQMPLAWWLAARAGMGATGVFVALTAAFTLFALASIALFRRGGWKTTQV
jgi:Na+-driven multidrug efflux pump